MVSGQVHIQPERLSGVPRPASPPLMGYAVAFACGGAGLALLTGLLRFPAGRAPSAVAGMLLVLLGLNRFLLTRWKSKPRRRRSFDLDRDR
jgi:hypothetical protein